MANKTSAYISVKKTVDLSKQPAEIVATTSDYYYGQAEEAEDMQEHKLGRQFQYKMGVPTRGISNQSIKTPASYQSNSSVYKSKSKSQQMFKGGASGSLKRGS